MIADHECGVNLYPNMGIRADDTAPIRMAYALMNAGQRADAELVCRKVLEQNPKQSAARHLLGLLAFGAGQFTDAIEQMRMAIAECEQPPLLYLTNLGLVLSAAGQLDQAVEVLSRACAMEPDHLDFNTKLAAVLLRAGRLEEAMATIRRSLQIKPMDMQALETERQIRAKQTAGDRPERLAVCDEREPAQNEQAGPANFSMTISARGKQVPASQMLQEQFGAIPLANIDSLFGFHTRCRLYGGREFKRPEIDDSDLEWMYANGINFRIPLTNKLTTEEDYEQEKPFLAMHHRRGNSVIVVKDELAKWIRRDFPQYKIEASVIRETNSADKLLKTLEVFDTVVPLPEAFNTNYELLASFSQDIKDRIRLFLNSGCAYHCPRRICYLSFSRLNRQEPKARFECSQDRLSYHFTQGMTYFPMQRYLDMGYRKFKVLRLRGGPGSTGF